MIPYFEQPRLDIGPLTIAAFGVIVMCSVMLGLTLGARRFRALGFDPPLTESLARWVLIGGFVGAHLFAVVFYFPEKIARNPLVLFKLWEDISSFGGIVGGTLALALFLRLRAAHLSASARWAVVDVVAVVFPISLMVGRLACAVAHDHPGSLTRFPLAVSLRRPEAQQFITDVYVNAGRAAELPPALALPQFGFHDLGWYELLFLALVAVPLLLLLARNETRPGTYRPGTYVVAFLLLYMPVRFLLDFLRVSDVRYGALTPAQWTALAALACVPIVVARMRSLPPFEQSIRSAALGGVPVPDTA